MSDDCTGCERGHDDGRRHFFTVAAGIALAAALPMRLLHALERDQGEVRYPIPAADSVSIDSTNEVILVRWSGKLYAFNLSCPHQNTALRWREEEKRFQCPKHKSRYQPDGTFISGRATRGMDRLAIRKDGGEVVVNVDTMFKQDVDPAGWDGAVLGV
jgi:nitrite reductase/ring-hydroxylating ferredoxin subunit